MPGSSANTCRASRSNDAGRRRPCLTCVLCGAGLQRRKNSDLDRIPAGRSQSEPSATNAGCPNRAAHGKYYFEDDVGLDLLAR